MIGSIHELPTVLPELFLADTQPAVEGWFSCCASSPTADDKPAESAVEPAVGEMLPAPEAAAGGDGAGANEDVEEAGAELLQKVTSRGGRPVQQ